MMKEVRKDVAKLKTLVDGNKLTEADKLFEAIKVRACVYGGRNVFVCACVEYCGKRKTKEGK